MQLQRGSPHTNCFVTWLTSYYVTRKFLDSPATLYIIYNFLFMTASWEDCVTGADVIFEPPFSNIWRLLNKTHCFGCIIIILLSFDCNQCLAVFRLVVKTWHQIDCSGLVPPLPGVVRWRRQGTRWGQFTAITAKVNVWCGARFGRPRARRDSRTGHRGGIVGRRLTRLRLDAHDDGRYVCVLVMHSGRLKHKIIN